MLSMFLPKGHASFQEILSASTSLQYTKESESKMSEPSDKKTEKLTWINI